APHLGHFQPRTLCAIDQSRAHPPSSKRADRSTARYSRRSRCRRGAVCGRSPKAFERCRSYGNSLIKSMNKRCKLPEKYAVRLFPATEAAEDREFKIFLVNR